MRSCLVAGAVLLRRPGESAVTMTASIAAFLMGAGLVRIVMASAMRMKMWGWVAVNGVLSVVLGYLILSSWPSSALWVIGLYVGIDLVVHGASLCALGSMMRSLRDDETTFGGAGMARP